MSRVTRRRVLSLTLVGVGGSLAGCIGRFFGSEPSFVIAAERTAFNGGGRVIRFVDLSVDERTFVREALESGSFFACEVTEAMRIFARRTGENTYLLYSGERYALWVSIENEVYSMTASPPNYPQNC